ncbi:hypothetical protein [Thiomicrorhabdus indica]|uniref:hypothetical protein n=1 Tax=Thiomicrorhabdus indica TaxID=2267253 RepID=UPI002AA6DEEB|nr:hypothetical protein [Thiomicrorhabdus indica]
MEKLKEFIGRSLTGADFDAQCKRANLIATNATTQAVVRSVAVGESNLGTANLELNGIPQGNAVTSEGMLIVDNNSTLDLVLDESFFGLGSYLNLPTIVEGATVYLFNKPFSTQGVATIESNLLQISVQSHEDDYYPLKLVNQDLYLTSATWNRVYKAVVTNNESGTPSTSGVGTFINSSGRVAFDGLDSVYSFNSRNLYRFDLSTGVETLLYEYTSLDLYYIDNALKFVNGYLVYGTGTSAYYQVIDLTNGVIKKLAGNLSVFTHANTHTTFDGEYYYLTIQDSATTIKKLAIAKADFESSTDISIAADDIQSITLPSNESWTSGTATPINGASTKFLIKKALSNSLFLVDILENSAVESGLLTTTKNVTSTFVIATPITDPTQYVTNFEIGVYGVEVTEE